MGGNEKKKSDKRNQITKNHDPFLVLTAVSGSVF